MMVNEAASKIVFVRRLGLNHFAYLRAIAEGLDLQDSAKRYLGVDHGHQARAAHRQTVDAVRMVARRRGDPAWRLIGLSITLNVSTLLPSLEDFIDERELDGCSEAEVTEMYAEAYPADPKSLRRQKLRQRQLQLLAKIEQQAAEIPLPTDLVSGWFDDVTSNKLISAGMITLGDLGNRIAAQGAWYRPLPGIGRSKALRIASHLGTLLPDLSLQNKAVFALFKRSGGLAPLPVMHTGGPSVAPSSAPS